MPLLEQEPPDGPRGDLVPAPETDFLLYVNLLAGCMVPLLHAFSSYRAALTKLQICFFYRFSLMIPIPPFLLIPKVFRKEQTSPPAYHHGVYGTD